MLKEDFQSLMSREFISFDIQAHSIYSNLNEICLELEANADKYNVRLQTMDWLKDLMDGCQNNVQFLKNASKFQFAVEDISKMEYDLNQLESALKLQATLMSFDQRSHSPQTSSLCNQILPQSFKMEKDPSFDDDFDSLSLPDPITTENNETGYALVITIEIGDGRQDVITVCENDDPFKLAEDFSQKHGLDSETQKVLTEHIIKNIEINQFRTDSMSPESFTIKHSNEQSPDPFTLFKHALDIQYSSEHHPAINTKSRAIANRLNRKGPVHDRLFQLRKKKQQKHSPVQSNHSESIGDYNYGERLYARGTLMKESQYRKSRNIQKNMLESNKDLTFKPSINKVSAMRHPRDDCSNVLYQQFAEINEKRKQAETQKELETQQECTFSPVLSAQTQRLSKVKSCEISVHENLYREADKLKEKRMATEDAVYQGIKFRPNIKITQQQVNGGTGVQERLLAVKPKQQVEIEDKEATFRPQISSKASAKRNTQGKPIHEYLYSMHTSKTERQQKLNQQMQSQLKAKASLSKVSSLSQQVYDQYRQKQYKYIFSLLDSNEDGKISSKNIAIERFSLKVLDLLDPIFKYIEESEKEIEEAEFCSMMEDLVARMSVEQKGWIFKRKKPTEKANPQKRSLLSVKSQQMMKQREPTDLYERQMERKKKFEQRIKEQQELISKSETEGCTFRPKIRQFKGKSVKQV